MNRQSTVQRTAYSKPAKDTKPAKSNKPTVPLAALSIREFCMAHGISEMTYHRWQRLGIGPRVMKVGGRTLISIEAAAEWRRRCESITAAK